MRAARLIAGSVLTMSALALTAPIAFADSGTASNVTPFAFKIFPTTVKAGGNIGLGVSGCEGGSASASAGVFDTVKLTASGSTGEFIGSTKIDADAKPGAQYDVKFTCGSSSGTTTLTVASGGTTTTTTTTTGTMPTGAVKTGLGGGSASMSSTEVAVGGAVVALALGGFGFSAVRRRHSGENS